MLPMPASTAGGWMATRPEGLPTRQGVFALTEVTDLNRPSVFGTGRELQQPAIRLPEGLTLNARNQAEGLSFLRSLDADSFPLCIFDPQYRGVLDRQRYGNEGSRQQERATLPQMDEGQIVAFITEIGRVLMPSGHLLLWVDKYHLCTGVQPWFSATMLS